jgi:hypothetical protein
VVSTGQRDRKELFQMITDVSIRSCRASSSLLPAGAAQPPGADRAADAVQPAVLYQTAGNRKAIEYYQRAIDTFPDYAEAQKG